ncbi:TonB-dependent receptor [Planctomycetaceae bacterium AH-315-I19]|nr:TonB-dependent receptor [Planctomycetaceae bacterium AH-315-I19]
MTEAEPPGTGDADDSAAPRFRLDPVIITATRTRKSLFDVPAIADVVTSQDIADAMYRTLPEALRDVPGVMIQKTGHGQGSPFIRGFTGFRNLLLIDGIRLNNSVFRDGPNQYWNTIDPNSISRLEIVKGPSSVLYGSDAIGGTVNVLTKGPNTYGDGFQAGGRGYYRFSSAERSNTFRSELSISWDNTLGLYAGGTSRDYGDLQTGAGRQPRTGYDELDGDFKVEYYINPNTRLVLAHQRVDLNDAWRTHRTIFGRPFEGTTVGNELRRVLDQNRELTYVQLHAENLNSFINSAQISFSYQSQGETRDRVRSDGRRDYQGFDVDTFGFWAQFESQTPIGVWTYGIEYYRDTVDSFRRDFNADGTLRTVRIQGAVANDATYDLVGVYIQNDIPITDALDLVVGGRFTYARADANNVADPMTGGRISVTEEFESLVGSARFVFRLDEKEHWNLFGGVSQGFRAPNLSDLTRFDSARSNEIETPAPGLNPEEFTSYEIGLKTRYEGFFAQASYFYTDINDMIIRQPTGVIIDGENEVTKRNSGSGFVQGVELQASWQVHPDFTAFGSFAWLYGEVDTFPTSAPDLVREPLSRLMPTTGQFGLRWDAPERDLWLEGVLTISARQDKLSSRDISDTQRIPPGGTPGYTVFTVRGGWQVDHNLALTAAIENLTNENYRVHGSGINEPGINFVLGVEYSF